MKGSTKQPLGDPRIAEALHSPDGDPQGGQVHSSTAALVHKIKSLSLSLALCSSLDCPDTIPKAGRTALGVRIMGADQLPQTKLLELPF